MQETQKFIPVKEEKITAREILTSVFDALKEKGYDPVHQLAGYLLSGDPTYITSFRDARSTVIKMERDELVEELLTSYLSSR